MRIEFVSKGYAISEKLRDIVTKKIEKLDKYFEDDTKIKVMLKEAHDVQTMELTIVDGSTVLRAEVSDDIMFKNIDIALPKLEKQILKHRNKLADKSKKFRLKGAITESAPLVEEKRNALVRTKTYELTPMTVEDAIDELELIGHSFYVFLNKATSKINVLYRRLDGDYGVIEAVA